MTTPTIKITYFDLRGRAEPLRLACVVGGLEFEDDRFKFPEFSERKAKLPYRAVPAMEIDGKIAVQSMAMLRYLGKLSKTYPDCPLAALMVDEVLDTIMEFSQYIFAYRGDDKEKLREARVELIENHMPRFMGGLEKRLEVIGGDGPWLLGDDITIADLAATTMVLSFKCGLLEFISPNVLDDFPRLMKSFNATMSHPKVAEWYKKHPVPNVTA